LLRVLLSLSKTGLIDSTADGGLSAREGGAQKVPTPDAYQFYKASTMIG
jgi:hypothetical protein